MNRNLFASAVILCLSGSADAAFAQEAGQAERARAARVQGEKKASADAPFHTQSELIGYDVLTVKGADRGNPTDLGDIQDIIFDPRTGAISYVLIQSDAASRALRWSDLAWTKNAEGKTIASIDLSQEEFEAIAALTDKDIEALVGGEAVLAAAGRLERKAKEGGAGEGEVARARAGAARSMSNHRATEIDDIDVFAKGTEEALCDLGDYVIDCKKGRVAFATMTSQGATYVVPIEKIAVRPKDRAAAAEESPELCAFLEMSTDEMSGAPTLSRDGNQSVSNPRFRKQVYAFYGVEQKGAGRVRRAGGR